MKMHIEMDVGILGNAYRIKIFKIRWSDICDNGQDKGGESEMVRAYEEEIYKCPGEEVNDLMESKGGKKKSSSSSSLFYEAPSATALKTFDQTVE
ncbi:hypothetical protein H5410_025172 [Solanum commersonii]|uniref:Uncharacterized protein n=1 Tax=Solanum commersonii TaxID=4109 RepID=A0A9J5YV58_SOLCO|nr:hypothetical protein H5410_025172 [Solanum commersonii]